LWATLCKTSFCPVLSVLSVTLVYCGQTVGQIKMKLGLEVGLGPGHIVLDGDLAPLPQRGQSPQFSAHICCGQMAGWIKMPLGMEEGLGPGDFVLDGDPAPPPQKGDGAPQFSAHVHCDHGDRPQPRRRVCVRWGPSPSPERERSPCQF